MGNRMKRARPGIKKINKKQGDTGVNDDSRKEMGPENLPIVG